jgi:hypothetical protein
MTTFADLVEKYSHRVPGGIAGGKKTKERADRAREDHERAIASMPQFISGQEFTRIDVVAATSLNESVANRALADMVEYNLLTSRKIDENGTIGYTPVFKGKFPWRKRPDYLADRPYSPRYY